MPHPEDTVIPPARRTWSGARSLFAAGALLLCACRGDADAMDRQRFIDTYVDLRTAALTNPGGQIGPAQRDSVLTKHGVTEEDLLHFAEVHGRDVDYMAEVWGEVESKLLPPETVPSPSP